MSRNGSYTESASRLISAEDLHSADLLQHSAYNAWMEHGELAISLGQALGDVEGLEHLGGGGQGLVWRFKEGGHEHVIKVLKEGSDPARIALEIKALRSVDSPYVMKFLEPFEFEHKNGLLQALKGEFVPGGTMEDKLQTTGKPTAIEALQCARGVLLGVNALHDHGLVHRDLKPQNVALRDGEWREPVVLDLGLVRNLDGSITVYPELIGTLPFMSPEQLRQERAVKRTDVFGIGAMLFYALTGTFPYLDPATDAQVAPEDRRLRMIARSEQLEWPRWSTVQSDLDDEVAEFLGSLIATEAFQRPTVAMALEACESLLETRRSL